MLFTDAIGSFPSLVSHYYEVRTGAVSYNGALTLSPTAVYRGVTGHLLIVDDDVETAFVKWYAPTGSYWLSVHATNNAWTYTSGPHASQNISYTNWLPGHPVSSSYLCADFDAPSGRWLENSCAASLPFIIEYECGAGYVFNDTGCTGSW